MAKNKIKVEKAEKELKKPVNTKAETDIPELSDEQKEFARMTVRKEFNEKFSKWAVIDDKNATDDDIAECKKDFEDCVEENKNKDYFIATHEDGLALKTAEFLRLWNAEFNTWEKGSWRGLIQFDRVINKIIDELKADDKKDFTIDYSTLIFLYQSMGEPKGTGIETARKMAHFENYNEETGEVYEEVMPVTYSGVLEKILVEVRKLSNIDKKLSILKERVNLAYAGLKMNLKISEIEEFLEFHEAITAHNVEQDPDVKKLEEQYDKK